MFVPAIKRARRKINREAQDDLEQDIIETIIKKISTYDLSRAPDFSTFCQQMNNITRISEHAEKNP